MEKNLSLNKKTNIIFLIIVSSIAISCVDDKKENKSTSPKEIEIESTIKTSKSTINESNTTNYDYATYYIVITDTSNDYYFLHDKMFELNRKLNIPIDTLGRYYNTTKNLIVLPDNDEDEVYAGAYFPRRFPSENLSLEYMNLYKNESGNKTIALVTGIYEDENSADSLISIIKKYNKKVFKIKTEMYVGCMH